MESDQHQHGQAGLKGVLERSVPEQIVQVGTIPSAHAEDVEGGWEGDMIERGAEAVNRRGKGLGTLEEVKLDPDTGQLQSALVHIGGLVQDLLGAGRTLEVTREIIAAVEQGRIRLSVSADELVHNADSGDMAA